MIKTEKKFPSIRKNDPHNPVVVVGIWICVATVAMIFIMNFSARRKTSNEPRVEIKQTEKIQPQRNYTYTRNSHAAIALTAIHSKNN